MAYIRSAGLRGVRAVVSGRGGDADALARRCGLPDGALDSDEMLVQDMAVALLLEVAAAELEVPDMGLQVALRQDLGLLGPVAVAIRNAATAEHALEMTSRYLFFHARSLEITVEADPLDEPGVVGVRFGYRDDAVALPPQASDLLLLFLHRALVTLLGSDYGLLSVELPQAANVEPERYRELFGAPVRAWTSAAILRVPAALLGRAISGGDLTAQMLAQQYLDRLGPVRGESHGERVRAVLERSLATGTASVAEVARILTVSPRTLQRNLSQEGASFSGIRDEVRRDLAARLLTTTDIPLHQIAAALALGDPTTLSQYARRWWGVTASQFRAGRRGSPPLA